MLRTILSATYLCRLISYATAQATTSSLFTPFASTIPSTFTPSTTNSASSTSPVSIPTGSSHIAFGAIIGIAVACFVVVLVCVLIVGRYAGWTWWAPGMYRGGRNNFNQYPHTPFGYDGYPQQRPNRTIISRNMPPQAPQMTANDPAAGMYDPQQFMGDVKGTQRNPSYRRMMFIPRGGKVPPGARPVAVPVPMAQSPGRQTAQQQSEHSYPHTLPPIPASTTTADLSGPESHPLPSVPHGELNYSPSGHGPSYQNLPENTGPVGHLGPYPDLRPIPSQRSGRSRRSSHRRVHSAGYNPNGNGPPSSSYWTYTYGSETGTRSGSPDRSRSRSPETGSYVTTRTEDDLEHGRRRSGHGRSKNRFSFSRHARAASVPSATTAMYENEVQGERAGGAMAAIMAADAAAGVDPAAHAAHHAEQHQHHHQGPPSTIQEESEPAMSTVASSAQKYKRTSTPHPGRGVPMSAVSRQSQTRPMTSDRRTTVEDAPDDEQGIPSVIGSRAAGAASAAGSNKRSSLGEGGLRAPSRMSERPGTRHSRTANSTWPAAQQNIAVPEINVITPTPAHTEYEKASTKHPSQEPAGVPSQGAPSTVGRRIVGQQQAAMNEAFAPQAYTTRPGTSKSRRTSAPVEHSTHSPGHSPGPPKVPSALGHAPAQSAQDGSIVGVVAGIPSEGAGRSKR